MPPGAFNAYGSEGPWFAAHSGSGLPCDDPLLFGDVRDDLEEARRHRIARWDVEAGGTLFYTFGMVTVLYTVVRPATVHGSGCLWRATYTSHGGNVLWHYMEFIRGQMRLRHREEFIVYPP